MTEKKTDFIRKIFLFLLSFLFERGELVLKFGSQIQNSAKCEHVVFDKTRDPTTLMWVEKNLQHYTAFAKYNYC